MSFLENLTARLPFGKKTENIEYFFALNIGLSEVTAAVWVVCGHELNILNQATFPYHNNEDLLDKAYQALDKSLGVLEVEPRKVLFGVPDSWNLDDNLKEPYLKLLRQILKECDLGALAYVTTTNAISFMLQKQEGVPPTAILLGLGDFVEITLVRGGNVTGTRTTRRTEHLFEDIEKTLSQFTEVEVLPSKILVYPTKENINLAKVKDELMSYPWMLKLSFLHFPKIEVLDSNVAIESIILAGASEMNPDIDLKRSFAIKKETGQEDKALAKVLEEKTEEETDQDLGFVKGDIKEKSQAGPKLQRLKRSEDLEKQDVRESPAFEAMGSKAELGNRELTGQELEDLENDNLVSPDEELLARFDEAPTRREEDFRGELADGQSFPTQREWEKESKEIGGALKNFWGKLSLPTALGLTLNKIFLHYTSFGKLLIFPTLILIALAAYLLLVKASVTIFVEPKILEKETEVVADPTAKEISEDKKIIPGKIVEITVSDSGQEVATGTKQIGDPAKGKVVLYNLTDSKVSFSQGTILTSSSGLKFTLDSSVQIASQSSSVGADFTTVIKPGKSDSVGVTAVQIGPESNLSAGTELTVGNFSKSQVVARVEEALSGGTAKDVTVVTSEDQKKLKAKVLDKLQAKAEKELQEKMTDGNKIISDALTVIDGKYNFSKQVNDQAKEFNLSATVRFRGTSYSETDLKTIVSKLIETKVPEGYEMNLQDAETYAEVARVEKDGKLTFKAKFRAKLLPKYDLADLKRQIRGKGVEEAASKLKDLEGVVSSQIKLNINLPIAPLSRLPFLEQNISVEVTPK